jgi:cytidylate kinase
MVVAIDGPAGAGKSTVARAVATELGWRYVDTGAMYRALTLAMLDRGLSPDDRDSLAELARSLDLQVDGTSVRLSGEDVSGRIRSPEVTAAVSRVAAEPFVRTAMVERQRALADGHDVVMEGRDIGTVVAPDAPVKVFLTASLGERAARRARELGDAAGKVGEIQRSIASRDSADEARSVSPLEPADDAVVIDTTDKSVREITAQIVDLVEKART